jgi:hypothetical protein
MRTSSAAFYAGSGRLRFSAVDPVRDPFFCASVHFQRVICVPLFFICRINNGGGALRMAPAFLCVANMSKKRSSPRVCKRFRLRCPKVETHGFFCAPSVPASIAEEKMAAAAYSAAGQKRAVFFEAFRINPI